MTQVSIIIPTYKRAEMLTRAIDSVLGQTFNDLEIIVVDDNNPNTDYRKNTEKLMRKYLNDSRVIYIKHKKNKNGAAARNTGISVSSGEYIGFLDDDDYFLPKKIEKQVQYLEIYNEYNGVYCGRFEKGKKIIGILSGDLSEHILSLSFTPTTPALMFRSHVLKEMGGFNEEFRRHQDFELLLRYFRKNKLGVVPDPLVVIGQNDGENELHGVTLEKNKEVFFYQFFNDINRIDEKVKGFKKNVYTVHYVPVFWDHISQKKFNSSFKIYFKGIKADPINFNITILKYIYKYFTYLTTRKRGDNGSFR